MPAAHRGIEQQQRNAAEVVAVQVRNQNRVDALRSNPGPRQGDHRRAPAIHQDARLRVAQQNACLQSPALAKRSPGAEKLDRYPSQTQLFLASELLDALPSRSPSTHELVLAFRRQSEINRLIHAGGFAE